MEQEAAEASGAQQMQSNAWNCTGSKLTQGTVMVIIHEMFQRNP